MTPTVMARSKRVRRSLAAIVVLATIAATSCGVPQDDRPELLAADDLLGVSEPTAVPPADTATALIPIYFVDQDNFLAKRNRAIPPRPGARDVLDLLLAGPSDAERVDEQLSTTIAPDWQILETELLVSETLIVNLGEGSLDTLNNNDQRLAIAQIVYSLTELPDVTFVLFELEGDPQSVPIDEGSTEPTEAVERADYVNADPAQRPPEPTPIPTATAVPLPTPDSAGPLPTPTTISLDTLFRPTSTPDS